MKISSIVVRLVVCFAFVMVLAQAAGQRGTKRKRGKTGDLRGARTGEEEISCGPDITLEKCYPMDMSGSCYHEKNACDVPSEFSCASNSAFNAEKCNKKFKAILKCIEGRKGCGGVVEREWKKDDSVWKAHMQKFFNGKSKYGQSNYNNIEEFKIGHLQALKSQMRACHRIFHANDKRKDPHQEQMQFGKTERQLADKLCTNVAIKAIEIQIAALQGPAIAA